MSTIDPSDMEIFARQASLAQQIDSQKRRSRSGSFGSNSGGPSWEADFAKDPNFGSTTTSGGKKQETVFKTSLNPEVAEEIGENSRGGEAATR